MLASSSVSGLAARYPLFATLSPALARELTENASMATVPSGTVLFQEGAPCSAYPLVLDGTVRVAHAGPEGREITLYRVQPGELCVLSSGSLLGNQPYAASGVAEGSCTVLTLPPGLFALLLDGCPAFRELVFSFFSERLVDLMKVVDAVAFRRLDERLAALLLERGPALHTTHQQLAAELGSVREIVTRVLNDFQSRGLVRLGREHLEVLDAPALRRLAGVGAAR
jgi:CRP/FNR family transcriptional regulator